MIGCKFDCRVLGQTILICSNSESLLKFNWFRNFWAMIIDNTQGVGRILDSCNPNPLLPLGFA